MMKVTKDPEGWKEDGKTYSRIGLEPAGESSYRWNFYCECDLTDYKFYDRVNIKAVGNKIVSHGSPWFGTGFIFDLFHHMIGISPTIAMFLTNVIYFGSLAFFGLIIFANNQTNNNQASSQNPVAETKKEGEP